MLRFSLQTKCSWPFATNPFGCFMYTSSSSSPFKKAVVMSTWCSFRPFCTARAITVLRCIVVGGGSTPPRLPLKITTGLETYQRRSRNKILAQLKVMGTHAYLEITVTIFIQPMPILMPSWCHLVVIFLIHYTWLGHCLVTYQLFFYNVDLAYLTSHTRD